LSNIVKEEKKEHSPLYVEQAVPSEVAAIFFKKCHDWARENEKKAWKKARERKHQRPSFRLGDTPSIQTKDYLSRSDTWLKEAYAESKKGELPRLV